MNLDLAKLKAQLRLEEGDKRYPYNDTAGLVTIGVGHNLTAEPLSDAVVELLLDEDIASAISDLDAVFPWWQSLDEVRARVLVDLCFNLGIGTLKKFGRTMEAVKEGRYDHAADFMLQSKWARQVDQRANNLSAMMRSGEDTVA